MNPSAFIATMKIALMTRPRAATLRRLPEKRVRSTRRSLKVESSSPSEVSAIVAPDSPSSKLSPGPAATPRVYGWLSDQQTPCSRAAAQQAGQPDRVRGDARGVLPDPAACERRPCTQVVAHVRHGERERDHAAPARGQRHARRREVEAPRPLAEEVPARHRLAQLGHLAHERREVAQPPALEHITARSTR